MTATSPAWPVMENFPNISSIFIPRFRTSVKRQANIDMSILVGRLAKSQEFLDASFQSRSQSIRYIDFVYQLMSRGSPHSYSRERSG